MRGPEQVSDILSEPKLTVSSAAIFVPPKCVRQVAGTALSNRTRLVSLNVNESDRTPEHPLIAVIVKTI